MKKHLNIAVFILCSATILVCFSSCSKRRKTVYPTHGQVFDKNGKPAAGALVIFHPVDESGPEILIPRARVDEKGNFALTTYVKNDGGPEGEYIITIEWRKSAGNPMIADKAGDLLKGQYSNPKTSKLKFKITNQPDNVIPPIHLK